MTCPSSANGWPPWNSPAMELRWALLPRSRNVGGGSDLRTVVQAAVGNEAGHSGTEAPHVPEAGTRAVSRLRSASGGAPDRRDRRDRFVGEEVQQDRVDQVRLLLGQEVRGPGHDGQLGVGQR